MFGINVKTNNYNKAFNLLKEAISIPVITSEVKLLTFYY